MILVPHVRGAGLFSQFNKLITVMEASQTADIYVDWRQGTLYGRRSDGNLFEHLFHQLAPLRRGDQRVSDWPHYRYTGTAAAALYPHDSWRRPLNLWWSKLRVLPALLAEADGFLAPHGSAVTAVHIRNSRIGAECPTRIAPTLGDYREALAGIERKVFLATDNAEAVHEIKELLGDRLLVRNFDRSPDMNTELHHWRRQTVRDAQDCLVDALIMARCCRIIHSVSNIATAVLYMNPAIPHTFVEHGRIRVFEPASE
jgi:hypothetical protein